MKRIMKWTGAFLLLCAVAFAGLIIVLPMVLDPNDYKDKISGLIYEQSGFQLDIPGDITLNISPRLEVLFSLGQVQVLSAPGFPDVPLLRSEEARVEFSLMPLLKEKRLVIQGIQLHGVYCHLIRDTSGKGNWEITATATESQAPSGTNTGSEATLTSQEPAKTKAMPTLELGAINLSRVTVRYEDKKTAKVFELKDLGIQTGAVQDGHSFHLKSIFTLLSSGSNNSVLSVKNTLEADVLFALSAKTLKMDNVSLSSLIKGFGIQDTLFTLGGNTVVDLAKKNVTLKELTLASGEVSIQADATVNNFPNPTFKGSLLIPDFSLGDFLDKHKLSQPVWKNDSALQQFEFSCDFAGDLKKINVSAIKFLLDGSHGDGNLILTDLSHPAYDFKMHFDRIDLDHYTTVIQKNDTLTTQNKTNKSTPKEATVKSTTSGKPAPLQPLFPVDLLRNLNFQLELDVDSMKIKGAEMSNVELKASGKDGQLELKPFRAELYEGTISTGINLDVRGKLPQLKLKNDITQVQIGPLLTDMTGKEEVTGAAVSSLRLKTKGNSKEQLTRNANGTMNLALEDGVIKKLHILQIIRQAKAIYQKKDIVQAAADEPTGFAKINATGVIKNGIFYNDDLEAGSDLMTVKGAGKVDFTAEYVDYLLKISIARGMDRNEKSGKTDYSKVIIPYRIQGEFSNLKEEADVVALFKSEVKNLLMDELQKQLDKNIGNSKTGEEKNSTKDLLERGLKSLFGN